MKSLPDDLDNWSTQDTYPTMYRGTYLTALTAGPLSQLREAPRWCDAGGHLSLIESEIMLGFQSKPLTEARAVVLATIVGEVYDRASLIELDDRLYEHGFIDALPLPADYSEAVDIGSPTSLLAARIQRYGADNYRRAAIIRLNSARKALAISFRQYRLQRKIAELDHARHTFAWGNRLAAAIHAANMRVVLACLNTPDNENRACKQAIAEVLGVKLTGLRSAARRRTIFSLCGLDEEAQLAWERFDSASQDSQIKMRGTSPAAQRRKSIAVAELLEHA